MGDSRGVTSLRGSGRGPARRGFLFPFFLFPTPPSNCRHPDTGCGGSIGSHEAVPTAGVNSQFPVVTGASDPPAINQGVPTPRLSSADLPEWLRGPCHRGHRSSPAKTPGPVMWEGARCPSSGACPLPAWRGEGRSSSPGVSGCHPASRPPS